MQITNKDIAYIANLARLEVRPEEEETILKKMSSIIEMANRLTEVDTDDADTDSTSNVSPTGVSPTGLTNVFRADEIKPSFDRAAMLQNAPTSSAGCYAVPSTF